MLPGLFLGACGEAAAPGPRAGAGELSAAVPGPKEVAGRLWTPGSPDAPTPNRVLLPRLKINAALDPLTLDKSGELIPPRYGRAGWYENGPEPGEPGRAVIAGHVDSKTGPDVFARLGQARVGDLIVVRLAGGQKAIFRVRTVGVFPQSTFPTNRVYGRSGNLSEIRLITCGGAYDRKRQRYESNVVVFARLVRA